MSALHKMIQILLLILKIIGIIILAVLGIIFLLLALVLFVPIFYQVRIIHNPQQTKVTAKVSFLWPAIVAVVQYLKKLSFKVKVFGIAILDSEKPKKEKTKKDKKPKRKKQKRKKDKKKSSETVGAKKEEDDTTAFLDDSDSLEKESKDVDSFAESMQQKEESSAGQTSDEEKPGVFAKIKRSSLRLGSDRSDLRIMACTDRQFSKMPRKSIPLRQGLSLLKESYHSEGKKSI